MRHTRPLRFDALEARQLLTRVHPAAHRAVAVPLVLSGTLAVDTDPNASTETTNPAGGTTTSVPVSGQLGSLGEVRGAWTETFYSDGGGTGFEALRLSDAKGTFTIAINTRKPERAGHGEAYAQGLFSGTGAYAGTSESGTIDMISNRSQTEIATLSLHTKTT